MQELSHAAGSIKGWLAWKARTLGIASKLKVVSIIKFGFHSFAKFLIISFLIMIITTYLIVRRCLMTNNRGNYNRLSLSLGHL